MRREKAPDNFSQCRKCGARIIFVRMKSGKSMPVNPNFVNFRRDGGKDRIVLANGEVTSGTIVTDPGEARDSVMYHILQHANTHRHSGGNDNVFKRYGRQISNQNSGGVQS